MGGGAFAFLLGGSFDYASLRAVPCQLLLQVLILNCSNSESYDVAGKASSFAANRVGLGFWVMCTSQIEESLEPVKACYPEIETMDLPMIPDWASLLQKDSILSIYQSATFKAFTWDSATDREFPAIFPNQRRRFSPRKVSRTSKPASCLHCQWAFGHRFW